MRAGFVQIEQIGDWMHVFAAASMFGSVFFFNVRCKKSARLPVAVVSLYPKLRHVYLLAATIQCHSFQLENTDH